MISFVTCEVLKKFLMLKMYILFRIVIPISNSIVLWSLYVMDYFVISKDLVFVYIFQLYPMCVKRIVACNVHICPLI